TTVSRKSIFTNVEVNPRPYGGEKNYLKKLSDAMGLPAEKPTEPTIRDSILVQSIVIRDGTLAELQTPDTNKPEHKQILKAIKKHSCLWLPAIQGGRPVMLKQKITIFYRRNQAGNIQSLTGIQYWYDDARRRNMYDADKEKQ